MLEKFFSLRDTLAPTRIPRRFMFLCGCRLFHTCLCFAEHSVITATTRCLSVCFVVLAAAHFGPTLALAEWAQRFPEQQRVHPFAQQKRDTHLSPSEHIPCAQYSMGLGTTALCTSSRVLFFLYGARTHRPCRPCTASSRTSSCADTHTSPIRLCKSLGHSIAFSPSGINTR